MLGTHGLLSVWKLMIFGFRKPLYFFDNFLPTVSPKAKSPISCGGEAGVVTLLDHIRWGGAFSYTGLCLTPLHSMPVLRPSFYPLLLSLFWVQKGLLVCLLIATSVGRIHFLLLC